MEDSDQNERAKVRMFPDYAETVLWFGGPVDYDRTGLAESLVRDLRAWEDSYYAALAPDLGWKSPHEATRFTEQGEHLAQRVADELGDKYEVEFTPYVENAQPRRFHGTKAPNPRAVTAFDVLATKIRIEQNQMNRLEAEKDGSLTAYAPSSNTIFMPPKGKDAGK
ncbi:hypothetical protein ACIPWF_09935 [Paenarthrobacter sp. NPDC089989]|uniref:hypothetical protein n=1 Tax=unclassified Paenarthrobacter TaxID=2634190 RepID=UPI003828C52F